jgi:ABC-type multidrug transport system permease subunit
LTSCCDLLRNRDTRYWRYGVYCCLSSLRSLYCLVLEIVVEIVTAIVTVVLVVILIVVVVVAQDVGSSKGLDVDFGSEGS